MPIKSATMLGLAAAGAVVTTGVVLTVGQLAQAASSTTGTASSTSALAPGQLKKTPSPSAEAEPPPKSLTVSAASVTGLAPGLAVPQTLIITNPNNQDVTLQSVTITLGVVSPSPAPGRPCSAANDIAVQLDASPVGDILKNSSKSVPVHLQMNDTSANQDGCKGKTFSFTFTATATSK